MRRWLRIPLMAGNVLYLLWLLANGINEGFRAAPVEFVALSGLMVLLLLNVVALYMWRGTR